jgi:spermidine synthase
MVSIAFPLFFVPQLGLMRTGLLFGIMNVLVACWALWVFRSTLQKTPGQWRGHWLSAVLVLAVLSVTMVLSERITTLGEERFYGERIAVAKSTPYQPIVLTQCYQGGHWRLCLNGHLQFNTRDEYRYHEALVHPVMAAQPQPKQVLILGGGDGMALREVLKYDNVEKVTLVELDPAMTTLFKDHPQLATLNAQSLHSPKVEVVNADAFLWLQGDALQDRFFDAIIVDFPDPTNYAIGKLYTTSFYQLLAARLRQTGYAVIQTTSPLMAPESFWTVATTLEAVGLQTRPYHAFVPSFGEWGFIIASHKAYVPPERLPSGLKFLGVDHLQRAFDFPLDMARKPTPVNRLSNQHLVTTFQREWSAHQ